MIDLDHHDSMLPAAVKWIEPTTGEIAGRLLDEAALPAGARILDVGAGTGPLVVAAASRGLEVVGVDIAPLTTTYLTGRVAALPLASTDLADANALPYPDDSFDAAFSVLAAMYAGPGALTEMRRVVRPGGTVAIVHWARSYMSPYTRIIWETSPELAVNLPALTPADFTAALTGAGFTDVRVAPITAGYALPAADEFLLEFSPFVITHPGYRAMSPTQRAGLDTALAARVRRIETGEEPRPPFEALVAWGRA
ncbi:SAM-dependent methyltransferase [Catenuloplanes nepalensis]|uniref:SAM-dependent methyltransferase n=1 Tax=Catenuloplanes nepalensis TaxID=587533 RepID=A0ABT9MX49_9ACTN|nr:class I SAM-dependent methyltransferase [Catenuloplanes nepalensis]MDP9796017.1 SAM-dependent methyltransferase [Catenuloplanes nepalensis]